MPNGTTEPQMAQNELNQWYVTILFFFWSILNFVAPADIRLKLKVALKSIQKYLTFSNLTSAMLVERLKFLLWYSGTFSKARSEQNGWQIANDFFKFISLKEIFGRLIMISLKFVSECLIEVTVGWSNDLG